MLARILRFFTENWALKLAALGLAVLLWLAVRASTPKRTTFHNIPVEVDLRDPDWRLQGQPNPPAVNVSVIGPTGELIDLASDPPRIVLPVERVSDTMETQVVPIQWVQLPEGLRDTRVLSLQPDSIRLQYQPLASETMPVDVRTRGDLPEGMALALPIQTNPATIQVRGPEQALEELDSVPLMPVDLSGLRSTTNVPTSVDTTTFGPGFRFTPSEVNVVLRVVPVDSQPPLPTDTVSPGG